MHCLPQKSKINVFWNFWSGGSPMETRSENFFSKIFKKRSFLIFEVIVQPQPKHTFEIGFFSHFSSLCATYLQQGKATSLMRAAALFTNHVSRLYWHIVSRYISVQKKLHCTMPIVLYHKIFFRVLRGRMALHSLAASSRRFCNTVIKGDWTRPIQIHETTFFGISLFYYFYFLSWVRQSCFEYVTGYSGALSLISFLQPTK